MSESTPESAAGLDGFDYCAEQVRRHDSDRYAAALFAPSGLRPALFALYAFNLEVAKTKEVVTQPMLGRMRLQWWRESIESIYSGAPRRHTVVLALAEAIGRHALSRHHFERLIDGREHDLDEGRPETLQDLESYSEATSAPLTLLALEAAGARDTMALTAGRHVGIAWGLTGVLRAVPFHARTGRILLPRSLLASAEAVHARGADPGIAEAARQIAEAARGHLAAARMLRPRLSRSARPALLPASLAAGYLERLRRGGYDVLAPAMAEPLASRAWRLAAARATGRF